MTGVYDRPQATLSVLIAIFASYAALDLAGPVTAASGRTRLIGGRTAMGIGIWAAHYIGMLASHFPQEPESRHPCSLRQAFVAIFLSLQIDGGKWSNIFSTDLSRSFNALAGLSGTVSVADPRQISLLLLLSNMSTTREPTS
jgi:hypothetical protein